MALRTSSGLWSSYDRVLHDTARIELPADVDREACRTIVELVASIERGEVSAAEDAQRAVRLVLGAYPRAHHHDPEALTTLMALALRERPYGVVLMAIDPRRGVPGRCAHPPSIG